MLDKKRKIQKEERAVLVGLVHKEQTEQQLQEYLDELAFLAETAGAIAVKRFTQKLPHPDSRHFVGKGKLEEIRKYVQGKDIRIVIFDDELTGAQINNIEKALEVKTIDRSDLILDIFANRAKTAQAKAQVELAQYQYILPRLRGMWTHLERLARRGSGESVRPACGTTRPVVDGCVIVRRRRCSGAVRASHHDVAVAAPTATTRKTPNTAISSSGVTAQYSTSTILRMISTPTTCRNTAVPII